ncbi:MAG: hypothetical protein ABEJ82_04270 [Haloplanus sp.]
MEFRDANRGQAIQIGAILVFAILILGISIYQATVVPQQNARVEFDGYKQASTDMVSLRNDIRSAATTGEASGTTVKTGVTYPQRSIFVNPGPPAGTISTDDDTPNVTLTGVTPVASETENVRKFWNATSGTYETKRVTFSPAYNEFRASPVSIVGDDVYRTPDSKVLPISQGSSIRSNRITLVTVRGDMGASDVSVPVTAEPVTAATRTVVVTGEGSTFSITLPTPTNATAWNDTVAPDLVTNPNVLTTTPHANDSVTITFNGSRRYELRLAAVEVHGRSNDGTVDAPPGSYLVPVTDNETAYRNRGKSVVAEVRNRYNNPVSGENVTFEVTDDSGNFTGNVTTRTVASDAEGRARVTFTPNATGPATVEARSDLNHNGSIEPYENTTFEFVTLTANGSATGGNGSNSNTGDINPGEKGDVLLEYAETGNNANDDQITMSFNNTANDTRTISEARVGFYYPSGSSSGAQPPDTITMGGTDLEIPGPYRSLNTSIQLGQGSGQTFTITANGGGGVPVPNDFLILSVKYKETGQLKTYFVALKKA